MPRQTQSESEPMKALRRLALAYPETQEGVVCKRIAFKARDKAFLFMGMDSECYDAMVKLRESLAEADRLAAETPDRFKVGGHGWVTVTFPHGQYPPPGLLERWIDESYRLLAPRQLVASLPKPAQPSAASTERTQQPPRRKKPAP